jgi:uncharacterized membrane protein YphA (DoxX/SURF4 family)
MYITAIVLSVLLAALFAVAGTPKVLAAKTSVEQATHLGYSTSAYRAIGGLELLAVIGLLIGLFFWPLGVAAAVGLALMMIGAAISHIRVGDGPQAYAPGIIIALLAIATVVVRALAA